MRAEGLEKEAAREEREFGSMGKLKLMFHFQLGAAICHVVHEFVLLLSRGGRDARNARGESEEERDERKKLIND